MDNRFVVLSGCSGGGKSSLLEELRSLGYGVIDEPGRRIVQMELESGGHTLPWLDLEACTHSDSDCERGPETRSDYAGLGVL